MSLSSIHVIFYHTCCQFIHMVIFMWGSFSYMCIFINVVEIHPRGTFDPYDKFSFILRMCINLENFIILLNSSICVDSILVVNFILKDSFSSMSIISCVSSLSPYGQLTPPPPLCGFPSMGN